jgi:hypothetical protein
MSQNVTDRRMAAKQLAAMRLLEPLVLALRDNDYQVFRTAAFALGQAGDVRALQPLMRMLNDKSHCGTAAECMSCIPQASAEQLVAALVHYPVGSVTQEKKTLRARVLGCGAAVAGPLLLALPASHDCTKVDIIEVSCASVSATLLSPRSPITSIFLAR